MPLFNPSGGSSNPILAITLEQPTEYAIATSDTPVDVVGVNDTRRYFFVRASANNVGNVLLFLTDATTVTGGSEEPWLELTPGAFYESAEFCPVNAISINSANVGDSIYFSEA